MHKNSFSTSLALTLRFRVSGPSLHCLIRMQIALFLYLTLPCSGVSHLVLTQYCVHQSGTTAANPITKAAHSCKTPVCSLFHSWGFRLI